MLGLAICASGASAQITNVHVTGVTNTQAVLSYTAPDANPCTVEASTSASFSPLAPDVDASLFPGANRDNRDTAVSSGRVRIFVIGQRLAARSADGRIRSRALQAFTTHYYRIRCGSAVASGQFTTANIPLGMTYTDPPQADPQHPGQYLVPPLPDDRQGEVIDPHTGALIKRVSMPGEATSPFLNYGGSNRVCGNRLVGPGPGFLCLFTTDSSYNAVYYIIPSSGESRFLGMLAFATVEGATNLDTRGLGAAAVNLANPLVVYGLAREYSGKVHLIEGTYSGDFGQVLPGASAAFGWRSLTPTLHSASELIRAFDPSFDPTLFSCNVHGPGKYLFMLCRRGSQDSYGWVAAIDPGTAPLGSAVCSTSPAQCPHVIAAVNVLKNSRTRWCGLHGAGIIMDYPLATVTLQNLDQQGLGLGPYYSTLGAAVGPAETTFTVSGELVSGSSAYGDTAPMPAQAGDLFLLNDSGGLEFVQLAAKVNATTWRVTRGWGGVYPARTHPAGARLTARCGQTNRTGTLNSFYWKFLEDPRGAHFAEQTYTGGHTEWSANYRISEGVDVVQGPLMNHLYDPLSFHLTVSPQFAGVAGLASGNSHAAHPSMHQTVGVAPASEQTWFMDMMPFDGGGFYSANPGVVKISGQLYQYFPSTWTNRRVHRKQLATLAVSGGYTLRDISGPGSSIGDGSAFSYTYCVAERAGECRPGSAAGSIYVNVPVLQYNYCTGSDGPAPNRLDICVTDMPAVSSGVVQFGMTANQDGLLVTGTSSPPTYGFGYSRVLTQGLTGGRNMLYFANAKSLPDASWALFTVGPSVAMAKLTPMRKADDLNRSTFRRIPLQLTPPPGKGVASAVVRFGYGENGPPAAYQCTSRLEACVAPAAAVADVNPFYYQTTESYRSAPCAAGCTITIPALPMRVAYFRAGYRNAAGTLVAEDRGVAVEGTVVSLGTVKAAPVTHDVTPPTAPFGIRATFVSATRVNLAWSASTDNVGLAGYTVYRDGIPIGATPVATYADTTAAASSDYYYRVSAYDAAGNTSALSADYTEVRTPAAVVGTLAAAPAIQAVVNAASQAPGVAAGSIATVWGSHMASSSGETRVEIDGQVCELLYAGPDQINLVVPAGITRGVLAVVRDGVSSAPFAFELKQHAPGLFVSAGQAVLAQHGDGRPVTAADPARRGETVLLYGTGLGAATAVRLGGKAAASSAGPAATSGLDQLKVIVPQDAPSGEAVPVEVTAGGAVANQVSLPVE